MPVVQQALLQLMGALMVLWVVRRRLAVLQGELQRAAVAC